MSTVTIRNASVQDGGSITGLFRSVFNKEMSLPQWRWKYRLAGSGSLCSAVATTADGVVVGHIGAIPLAGSDHSRDLFVWQLSDAMVHPGYRGRNLFSDLLLQVGRSVDSIHSGAVCYAFAGPESTRIGIRKGILLDKGKISCYRLDSPGSSLRTIGWSLEPTAFSDSRLQELWEIHSPSLSVFTERNSEYLNWRYAENPFHNYKVALVKHYLRPAGWLVWTAEADGLKIMDLCIEKRHTEVILALAARKLGTGGKLLFWLPDSLVEEIDMKLTSEETLIHLMFLNHRFSNSGGAPPAGADRDFYFTMGDVDIY